MGRTWIYEYTPPQLTFWFRPRSYNCVVCFLYFNCICTILIFTHLQKYFHLQICHTITKKSKNDLFTYIEKHFLQLSHSQIISFQDLSTCLHLPFLIHIFLCSFNQHLLTNIFFSACCYFFINLSNKLSHAFSFQNLEKFLKVILFPSCPYLNNLFCFAYE